MPAICIAEKLHTMDWVLEHGCSPERSATLSHYNLRTVWLTLSEGESSKLADFMQWRNSIWSITTDIDALVP